MALRPIETAIVPGRRNYTKGHLGEKIPREMYYSVNGGRELRKWRKETAHPPRVSDLSGLPRWLIEVVCMERPPDFGVRRPGGVPANVYDVAVVLGAVTVRFFSAYPHQ